MGKMKKGLAFVLAFVSCARLVAQVNLVPNGDFESFKKPCHHGLDGISLLKCTSWFAPTLGTSDWYNECEDRTSNGVPQNYGGYMPAQSGSSYVGFYTFYKAFKSYKEYVAVELNQSLEAGEQYRLRFYIALAKRSDCYTNRIGALLSVENPFVSTGKPLLREPSIYNTRIELKEISQWMLVDEVYTAKGGEKFLTIGKFGKDQKDDLISLGEYKQRTYYYIDNVSLELVEEEQPSYK